MSRRTLAALAGLSLLGVAQERPAEAQQAAVVDSQSFLEANLPSRRTARPDDARRVQELLGQMTLREKVGQMTQLTIAPLADGKDQALRLNSEKLRKAVVEYGIGSILNVSDTALPVDRWRDTIRQIQAAAAQTRLKIPVLYGIDSIHGANYVRRRDAFPTAAGHGGHLEPRADAAGSQITARRRAPPASLELLARPRHRPPAALAAAVRDLRRRPLPGDGHGRRTVRGYEGTDPASPTQRRLLPEALHGLQPADDRARSHAGADS